MYKIIEKKIIAPGVTQTEILAPKIAKKRKPGQFVILRFYEEGERIPLTIADSDEEKGTITIISQNVGKSTAFFEKLPAEEGVLDVVGPLGHPTKIENFGNVVCIGGGIGIAPVYPIAKGMKEAGNHVVSIIGAKTKDALIFEDRMKSVSDKLYVTTDDGSYGEKGFVSDVLRNIVADGLKFNLAVVIGPVPMMSALSAMTKEMGIPTIVSLNSLMVDGTGMCGACRVSVGGETKFTCVDGPEFDGHKVDFSELAHRLKLFSRYTPAEREKYESENRNPNCTVEKASNAE